jgi:hypothetical protein
MVRFVTTEWCRKIGNKALWSRPHIRNSESVLQRRLQYEAHPSSPSLPYFHSPSLSLLIEDRPPSLTRTDWAFEATASYFRSVKPSAYGLGGRECVHALSRGAVVCAVSSWSGAYDSDPVIQPRTSAVRLSCMLGLVHGARKQDGFKLTFSRS